MINLILIINNEKLKIIFKKDINKYLKKNKKREIKSLDLKKLINMEII